MIRKTTDRLFACLVTCIFLLPLTMTFVASFMTSEELNVILADNHSFRWIPYEVTLSSYWKLLFSSQTYLATFWNSMLISVVSTFLQVFVSLVVGYVLTHSRFRGKRILIFTYILFMLMPFQVTLLPQYTLSKTLGLFNTWWALILPSAFAPVGTYLMLQFMREIPKEVIEATYLDTSTNFRVLFSVVTPIVKPGLLTVAVLSFAESWNMVEQPLVLLQDEWLYPLSIRLNTLSNSALDVRFSGAVLFMIPAILLYLLFENQLIEGLKHMKL